MNAQNSADGTFEPTSAPYRDRSSGLKVFGVLTILLGSLAGLCTILMLVGQVAGLRSGAQAMPVSSTVIGVLVYLLVAVVFIWLGIGSFQARRWARALMLIVSWSWLVVGVVATITMFFVMPNVLAGISAPGNSNQSLPPSAIAGVIVVMGVVFGVMFVIVPTIWTVFYQSRHVKATCEALDPVTRWTDACPLPLLALSLWLVNWVPWLLVMSFTGHPMIPFFGTFLTGVPAVLVSLIWAAASVCAAWLLYKLDVRGWWLALTTMVLYLVSSLITFSRHSFYETYQLMGYSAAQLKQVKKSNLFGQHMTWMTLIFMVPFIGYILFIKKYFPKRSPT